MEAPDLKGVPRTNGDWTTLLLAGSLGYTLDAALNIVGFFEPGVCGSIFAATALGLKRAIESRGDTVRNERTAEEAVAAEVEVTRNTIAFLKEQNIDPAAVQELEALLELAEIRQYSAAELREKTNDILKSHNIPF